MSIEKYLARHEQEPGRLHDLTIETHERPRAHFDPERDLTETDWQGMEQQLSSNRTNSDWRNFAHLASAMHLLDPSRDLHLTDSDWQVMEQQLSSSRTNNRWWYFATLASRMHLLSAEKVEVTKSGIKLTMPGEDFKQKPNPRPERRQF